MAAKVRDIGDYSNAELIGKGGFGAVYRATDETHGREVAIKVLPRDLGEAEKRRFDRERQTMGRLGAHPFIIPVYESGYTDDGEAYIVMELASGGSLRERLKTAPVPWAEGAKVMAAIADAAQAAHDYGVLHRDIKPDNVLIDNFGNPKLSDFGIAAVASNATATTSTVATVAHAAPELLDGGPSTPAIDIYAIGSTLFALITGRPPFFRSEDNNVAPMIGRIRNDPPPNLRPFGIPDDLSEVIERAMAKDPDDRYASASDLAEALRAASAGHGPPTGPLTISPNDLPTVGRLAVGQDRTAQTALGYRSESEVDPESGLVVSPPQRHAGPAPTTGVNMPGAPPLPPHKYQSTQQPSQPEPTRTALLATIAVVAVVLVGVVAFLIGRGSGNASVPGAELTADDAVGDTVADSSGGPDESGASLADDANASATPSTLASAPAGAGEPTVDIRCPGEIALGVKVFCSIFSTEAMSGEWHLPAFLVSPEQIETVPGEYEIFIEPTNPEAVGQSFTITADVEGHDGQTARATHEFSVVAVLAEIDCPDRIALNDSVVCDIVSHNATEGEWSIPGFGRADLEIVPGANPIFIEPSDPDGVGDSYGITVIVRNNEGDSYTATSEFVVVPSNS